MLEQVRVNPVVSSVPSLLCVCGGDQEQMLCWDSDSVFQKNREISSTGKC